MKATTPTTNAHFRLRHVAKTTKPNDDEGSHENNKRDNPDEARLLPCLEVPSVEDASAHLFLTSNSGRSMAGLPKTHTQRVPRDIFKSQLPLLCPMDLTCAKLGLANHGQRMPQPRALRLLRVSSSQPRTTTRAATIVTTIARAFRLSTATATPAANATHDPRLRESKQQNVKRTTPLGTTVASNSSGIRRCESSAQRRTQRHEAAKEDGVQKIESMRRMPW